MPLTHPRQIAEWQARFNRVCRDVLEPALAPRGYIVSLDHVSEEVEPDSLGPFYVGEVGLTRPLPGDRFAHLILQSTTQTGKPVESLTVDLYRDGRPAPPQWPAAESEDADFHRRVNRPDTRTWEFRDAGELRRRLAELLDRLTAAGPDGHSPLDEVENPANGTNPA